MSQKQLDILDVWPKRFINWFESQEELTPEQETELDSWYDNASPETLELVDAFTRQLELDTAKEAAGSVFFNTPIQKAVSVDHV